MDEPPDGSPVRDPSLSRVRPLNTGRPRHRTDLGRARRWGWVAPGAGRHGGFGVYVEALRRARNLAQGELARSLGMKTPQYRALLKHPVPPPDFETVVRIVRLLDADPLEAAMRAWGMAPEEAAQVMESEYPDVWRSRRVGQPPIAKSRVWDAG